MDKVTAYSFLILAMMLALPVISHMLRKSPVMLKYTNYMQSYETIRDAYRGPGLSEKRVTEGNIVQMGGRYGTD